MEQANTRDILDLNAAEVSALAALNAQLADAERWVLKRSEQALQAYYLAGGVKNHQFDERLTEDVEVEAKVVCVLRADHPDSSEDDDNIVATLDATILTFVDESEGPFSDTFGTCRAAVELVREIQPCWLFHDLVSHVLDHDWDSVLSIGGLWIDVSLIQQQMRSW